MSRKKEERHNSIVRLIAQQSRIEVNDLSVKLGVSRVTIRKDLDELESKGVIKRAHGYAVINDSDDISSRLAIHYDEKKKIALKASELINDGDTVIIESGSCCALLAAVISEQNKHVTIITNSVFIAEYLRNSKTVDVILLGGVYQKDSQCLVGPSVRESVGNYHVRYLFAGTDGYSAKTGFTNKDTMRAQAVRDMSCSCDEAVILTESEKFRIAGTIPLNLKARITRVITDSDIKDGIARELSVWGIKVVC